MAAIDIGGAIGSGFGLIGRKPRVVLAWGLLMGASAVMLAVGYAGFFGFALRMQSFSAHGAEPSQAQVMQMISGMLMGEGLFFLAALVVGVIFTIVSAAVWRSILHPERAAWAYLRVGSTEVFVFLLRIAVGFVAGAPIFALFPVMFIALGVGIALHQYILAVAIYLAGFVAMFAAQIYIMLRFSLIGPMIVDDGKLHFADAWRLTRGRAASLFLVGLGLYGIFLACEMVIGGMALASVALNLSAAAGGFDHVEAFFRAPPPDAAWRFWPVALGWGLAAVPLGGTLSAIGLSPWARAYRDLVPAPVSPAPGAPAA